MSLDLLDLIIWPYKSFSWTWNWKQIKRTDYGWSQTKPNVEGSIGGQTLRSTFRRDFYNIESSVNVGALYRGTHYWASPADDVISDMSVWSGRGWYQRTWAAVWILSGWGRFAPGMDRGTDAEPPWQRRSSNGHRCSTRFRINTRCLSNVCHHVLHVIGNPTHSQKGWKLTHLHKYTRRS